MTKKILRERQVEDKTGQGRSQIYKLMSEGKFPRPVKLGRISGWIESEVDQWIDERIAERDGQKAVA